MIKSASQTLSNTDLFAIEELVAHPVLVGPALAAGLPACVGGERSWVSLEPGELCGLLPESALRRHFESCPDLADQRAQGTDFDDWLRECERTGLLCPASPALATLSEIWPDGPIGCLDDVLMLVDEMSGPDGSTAYRPYGPEGTPVLVDQPSDILDRMGALGLGLERVFEAADGELVFRLSARDGTTCEAAVRPVADGARALSDSRAWALAPRASLLDVALGPARNRIGSPDSRERHDAAEARLGNPALRDCPAGPARGGGLVDPTREER